jgi:hypothetical protein
MSLLANNLIVLLYLQICRLQDNSSSEGGVEGKNGFHAKGLSLNGAKKETGLVRGRGVKVVINGPTRLSL